MQRLWATYRVSALTSIIPLGIILGQIIAGIHYHTGIGIVFSGLFFLAFFISTVSWGEKHSKGCARIIAALIATLMPVISLGLYGFTTENLFIMPFIGCFVSAFSAMIVTGVYRKLHNEKWYRQTYPHCITERKKENAKHGKTRIACYHCNSGYLKGQNLMNKTFTRRMYCGDCQTTLFYAGEER